MKKTYTDILSKTTFASIAAHAGIFASPLLLWYMASTLTDHVRPEYASLIKLAMMSIGLMLISVFLFGYSRVKQEIAARCEISDNGLHFFYPSKDVSVSWNEVKDIERKHNLIGDMACVVTERGNFCFRATMKNEDNDFPRLKRSAKGFMTGWIDENGREYDITFENCELYNEILDKLKNRS